MEAEIKALPCGCTGAFRCAEARALWAEVNAKYETTKGTEDWQAYDEALAVYRRHFEEEPDG